MPDLLIYKLTKDVYRIINTKTFSHAGDMKTSINKRNPFQKELWIDALILNAPQRNQGIGTKILKFAEILSKEMGFKGRLGVTAAKLELISDIPPHKFYRRFGFKSRKKEFNHYINEFIEQNEKLDFLNMPPLDMTYTPSNQPLKQKIIDWFCNLFS